MQSPVQTLDASTLLGSLPPVWPQELLPALQSRARTLQRKLIVLDDDPTGTQTVHDIRIYTDGRYQTVHQALAAPEPTCFILTNSRSLPAEEARALGRELGGNIRRASEASQRDVTVISRSDSTLRGHFPAEVDALAQGLGGAIDATLLIPAFFEGQRITVGDVHYLRQADQLLPVGESEFAQDPAFGFRASNLREWVEEKTGGAVTAQDVASIGLDLIRQGGPEAVATALRDLDPGQICVVNAVCYRDIEVVALAALSVEEAGKRLLYRSAASFVRARAGVAPRALLEPKDLALSSQGGGLVIMGSYVPTSTAQLKVLLRRRDVAGIELSVSDLLNVDKRDKVVAAAASSASSAMGEGKNVVVYTSRERVDGTGPKGSLATGKQISACLVDVLQRVTRRPRFLVAKGGITSHVLAATGLEATQALVRGQIAPGVSVWEIDQASHFPGIPYVVFPGNVGDEDTLAKVVAQLGKQQSGQA